MAANYTQNMSKMNYNYLSGGRLPQPFRAGHGALPRIRRAARGFAHLGVPTETICIFNLNLLLVPDVYSLLKRAASDACFKSITKIRRICQRDGLIRFEIDASNSEVLYAQLARQERRMGWSVHRKDITHKANRLRRMRLSHVTLNMPLKICSLNINGTAQKMEDLAIYLDENDVDIIGLQETRRKADHWRLSICGYNVMEVTSTKGAGQRGLAIAVRKDISAFQVGNKSMYFIFVRVFGAQVAKPFIIGSIYLPHRHANHRIRPDEQPPHIQAKLDLAAEIVSLKRKYPTDLITLMGDFNRNVPEMESLMQSLPGLTVEVMADQTFPSVGNRRAIDHFVVTTSDSALLQNPRYDTSLEISDHFPILADLHYRVYSNPNVPIEQKQWKVPSRREEEKLLPLLSSNRFRVLMAQIETEDFDNPIAPDNPDANERVIERVHKFVVECQGVANSLNWINIRKNNETHHPTSKAHLKACRKRRRMYSEYRYLYKNRVVGWERALEVYKHFRKISNEHAKKAKSDRWAKTVHQLKADQSIAPRKFWKWISSTSGWKRKDHSSTLQPMQDTNGVLQTEGVKIAEVWRTHYLDLAADKTGNSQNPEHWENILPDIIPHETMHELNETISIDEVRAILLSLKKNKAPGKTGIPVEFFQAFIPTKSNDDARIDELVPLMVLTEVLNAMWISGVIPDTLNEASLVSVFKKGDPSLTGNYRGISLIESLLKVLITLVAGRLLKGLEAKNFFTTGQAGYRSREESVAQTCALYEIIKRRLNCDMDTFSLFLDYEKAFDTVPHEGLFKKMDIYGIRGRMMNFVRSLYHNSLVSVRVPDGSFSEPFRLLRGVRQGCPLSSVLFNLFINDMFDIEDGGVAVPFEYNIRTHIPKYLPKISGLMFCDDAVALEDSENALRQTLLHVEGWALKNELTFGVSKCGLLQFSTRANFDPLLSFSDPVIWSLQGVRIPVVNAYTYLGLEFHHDLSLLKMVAPRARKGENALYHFRPFLSCPSIPLSAKIATVKAIIIPTMLYGAEIWGMKVSRIGQMQKSLNKAARWILNFRGPEPLLSIGCCMSELGLQPIRTLVAVKRTRGYIKFPTLNTWVAKLMGKPLRLRRKNWQTITEQWLNRNIRAQVGRSAVPGIKFGEDMSEALERTRSHVTRCVSVQWARSAPYFTAYLGLKFPSLVKIRTWIPYFGNGLLLIMLMRSNGYHLQKRIEDGVAVELRKNQCPYCRANTPEDVEHMFLDCFRWTALRQKYLTRGIEQAKDALGTAENHRPSRIVNLLLGGTVALDLDCSIRNWFGVTPEDAATASYGGDSDAAIWRSSICYEVGGFLHEVDTLRRLKLNQGHLQADENPNAPFDGQDPYG